MDNFSSFNIEMSMNSGQMFLWEKHDSSWYGVYGEHILKVSNLTPINYIASSKSLVHGSNHGVEFLSFPEIRSWERYVFRFDDEIEKILATFSKDRLVSESIRKYPGLRLMRQKPYQCMISFV